MDVTLELQKRHLTVLSNCEFFISKQDHISLVQCKCKGEFFRKSQSTCTIGIKDVATYLSNVPINLEEVESEEVRPNSISVDTSVTTSNCSADFTPSSKKEGELFELFSRVLLDQRDNSMSESSQPASLIHEVNFRQHHEEQRQKSETNHTPDELEEEDNYYFQDIDKEDTEDIMKIFEDNTYARILSHKFGNGTTLFGTKTL